ncbi:MAG TPA: hypothetical protein VFJ58_19735 [Armatimonadota bacterium]|nr:hypothetical protein [Armatimonadota bacterium]
MSPQHKFLGMLYLAWAGLLMVTFLFQRDRTSRLACLCGTAGFAVLGANLFINGVILHNIIRVAALAILGYAGFLSFRVRSRPAD